MKLMTKEIEAKLPKLYTNENKKPEETPIIIKFFHPFSGWAWYATEGEKQENGDWMFFGWVHGDCPEMGYFCLSELQSVKIHGLPIERDRYFEGHMLSEAMKKRI